MKLAQLKTLLQTNRDKQFLLQLPNCKDVPHSFHITEVGFVEKKFIDCGGKTHAVQTCQLQAWIGPDIDHRIEAGKMADILEISASILPHEFLEVEIEYEDEVISQYPISNAVVNDESVVLQLTTKHTACLAKELCGVPSADRCGPIGCC